jgi:hypothetical protein
VKTVLNSALLGMLAIVLAACSEPESPAPPEEPHRRPNRPKRSRKRPRPKRKKPIRCWSKAICPTGCRRSTASRTSTSARRWKWHGRTCRGNRGDRGQPGASDIPEHHRCHGSGRTDSGLRWPDVLQPGRRQYQRHAAGHPARDGTEDVGPLRRHQPQSRPVRPDRDAVRAT